MTGRRAHIPRFVRRYWRWGIVAVAGSVIFGSSLDAPAPRVAAAQARFGLGNVSVRRVLVREKVAGMNFGFDPVPTGYTPGLDAQQALVAAEAQLGSAAHPTAATETLGTMVAATSTGSSTVIVVWNVDFAGICQVRFGGNSLPSGSPCLTNDLNVVLDATTGEFIEAYNYSGPGP